MGLTLAHEGGIDVEHIVGADVLCAVLFESSEAVPDAETPPDDDSVSCGRTGRGIGRIRTHCTRDSRTGNSSSGTIVCWARVEALLTSLPADDDADCSPCARALPVSESSVTSGQTTWLSIDRCKVRLQPTAGALNLIDPDPDHRLAAPSMHASLV